jgi:hypothetical protein
MPVRPALIDMGAIGAGPVPLHLFVHRTGIFVHKKIMQYRNLNFPDEVIQPEQNRIFNLIVKFN